jgi:prephenate dehydrogenase
VKLTVVGIGLIGGSIGLAAAARAGAEVTGFDPAPEVAGAALARGAVTRMAETLAEALDQADAAFVAVPVGVLAPVVDAVLAAAPSTCVVSDVGSTKRIVAAAAEDQRFVGGHPLAGAETAGVAHARAELFDGATWYLTPTSNTSGVLYERLHRLIVTLGAQPTAIDAEAHDRLLASSSHLPHVLANVLASHAADALRTLSERPAAAGPSLRDATRVAGANAAIWPDIYLANADALLPAVDDAVARLQAVRAALHSGDRDTIAAWHDQARRDRDALLGAGFSGGAVLHELRVSVPNRPGVIADIALALGRAGVNIVDLSLAPSADDRQGVVALWVRGDAEADRAQALLAATLDLPVARA